MFVYPRHQFEAVNAPLVAQFFFGAQHHVDRIGVKFRADLSAAIREHTDLAQRVVFDFRPIVQIVFAGAHTVLSCFLVSDG